MTTHPSSTRAPRRDAAANREALMAAAVRLLNVDPAVSLEAIASEAGLSRRSVYGHFATRDDLVREVSLRGAARIGAAAMPAPSDDPAVQLAELGARLWSEVEHVRVMAQLTVRGPLMREVGTALAPVRAFLLETVRRGVAEGRMRDDVRVETLAHLVEGSALAVLDEATVRDLDRAEGHRLVMLAVLGMVGLGWQEAGELIRSTPALALPVATEAGDRAGHDGEDRP
ncbi:TetR/AcrR family transcriptional regulator [Frigoribacterium faeni]|uniref:TetR/AcrR family transcriptional regulator n=1 Tax=Frigoribacterium faeni TaxID=145483 RepID=UPI003266A495|nr:AcrR family transcriptional regulator [Frigoribacterium faeni]